METLTKKVASKKPIHDAIGGQQTDGKPWVFDGEALWLSLKIGLVYFSLLLRGSFRLDSDFHWHCTLLLDRQIQFAEKIVDFVGGVGQSMHESLVFDGLRPSPEACRVADIRRTD